MKMYRCRFAHVSLLLLLLTGTGLASTEVPEILAFVGEDTLTTVDLRIELNLMERRAGENKGWDLPDPADALKRMTQNRLIVQEGYRMGLDQEFTVKNQVNEAVNSRCMGALLDSVALAVPTDIPELKEARRLAVRNYIEDLMVKYDVQVDSTLLLSLDYGSSDPEMARRLRESDAVLAIVPTGQLKVSAFSRIIRFTAFHGLEGKPDAAVRRDQIFHEWVSEAVTIHEARRQDIRMRPEIQLYQKRLERTLMLEETLKILLKFPFEPTAEEIEASYQKNIAQFMNAARVRMESLKFETEEAAAAAREKLVQGAKLSWIKGNMEQVIQGPPPFPNEFFETNKLNLKPEEAVVGFIPGPYGVPGGWVLARVTDVLEPAPIPLAECRDQVLRLMKGEATRNYLQDIISRLEEAVEVRVQPGAEEIVQRYLLEWKARQEQN
jgi:hypothetical protein